MKLRSEIRWFCLKETYIAYLDSQRRLCFPMLVDMDFSITKGIKTGLIHGISIKNSQRSVLVKCQKGSLSEWHDSIKEIEDDISKDFCTEQRFKSFAPERENQICKWFVNAGLYMEMALEALNEAKEEIMITDWWFSPEIFLKRPTEDLQYRLDQVLLKKSVNYD
jgi:phospholipase D1/2